MKKRLLSTILSALALSVGISTAVFANEATNEATNYDYEYGYAAEEYVPNTTFITTVNALRLRTAPCLTSSVIRNMPIYTLLTVEYFDPDAEWTAVIANGTHGYSATRYIAPAPEFAAVMSAPVVTIADPQVLRAAFTPNGTIELLPWSYVRTIMPIGTHIHVYDIGTGITYTVRNFSNGNHADVETLTRADTDAMRISSGGFSWCARPVLVTFNGRTVAAAINTMPHAGWTIQNNGMYGHICLHFYGSRTHNGNRAYEREMQAAVQQAFNHR